MSRSYDRSKETISYSELALLVKLHFSPDPDCRLFASMDPRTLCCTLKSFLVACATKTNRLNEASLSKVLQSQFHCSKDEGGKLGHALQQAFSYAKRAGDKASSGSKLLPAVWLIHTSFPQNAKKAMDVKAMDAKPVATKQEMKEESSPPRKKLHKVLSSPSAVLDLYSGSGAVKVASKAP